jgi:hypothetical protein
MAHRSRRTACGECPGAGSPSRASRLRAPPARTRGLPPRHPLTTGTLAAYPVALRQSGPRSREPMKDSMQPGRFLAYLIMVVLLAPPPLRGACCPDRVAHGSFRDDAPAADAAGGLRAAMAGPCHGFSSHERSRRSHDPSTPAGAKLAHPCNGCIAHFAAIPPSLRPSAVTGSVHAPEAGTAFLDFIPPPRTRPPIRA